MSSDDEVAARLIEAEVVEGRTTDELPVPKFPVSCPGPSTFTYFTERYFSQYIVRDCKGLPGNHVRILLHSNGLCVVCLDPSHVVCKMKVVKVQHSLKKDRTEPIRCQGKRKKNAVLCQKDMVICFIDVEGGPQIRVPACVDGLVLEFNPYLSKCPELLQLAPTTEGYLAVVNPHTKMRFDQLEQVSAATNGEMALDME